MLLVGDSCALFLNLVHLQVQPNLVLQVYCNCLCEYTSFNQASSFTVEPAWKYSTPYMYMYAYASSGV